MYYTLEGNIVYVFIHNIIIIKSRIKFDELKSNTVFIKSFQNDLKLKMYRTTYEWRVNVMHLYVKSDNVNFNIKNCVTINLATKPRAT